MTEIIVFFTGSVLGSLAMHARLHRIRAEAAVFERSGKEWHDQALAAETNAHILLDAARTDLDASRAILKGIDGVEENASGDLVAHCPSDCPCRSAS